jgi:hypothetical protein
MNMTPITSSLNLTPNEWADKFWSLYSNLNNLRRPSDIWLSVVKNTSEIAEGLRKAEYQETRRAMAHTFCWICAFYNKIVKNKSEDFYFETDLSLAKFIGFKYPNVCGRCTYNACTCGLTNVDQEGHSLFKPRLIKLRKSFFARCDDYTLNEFGEMFCDLFSNSIYRLTIETIAFHLMEEVGETARCVRKLTEIGIDKQKSPTRQIPSCEIYEQDLLKQDYMKHNVCINLVEEIADTISFLFALSVKLSLIESGVTVKEGKPDFITRLDSAKGYLTTALAEEYGDPHKPGEIRCPDCGKNPCECNIYGPEDNE